MADLNPGAVLAAVASDPRLRVFIGGGTITTMPARQSRRRLLLDVIARAFEPGVRYPACLTSDLLASRLFRATPRETRQADTSLLSQTASGRQADRESAHRASERYDKSQRLHRFFS